MVIENFVMNFLKETASTKNSRKSPNLPREMFRLRKRPKKMLNLYLRLFHSIEAEYINQKQNKNTKPNFILPPHPPSSSLLPPPKKVNSGKAGII